MGTIPDPYNQRHAAGNPSSGGNVVSADFSVVARTKGDNAQRDAQLAGDLARREGRTEIRNIDQLNQREQGYLRQKENQGAVLQEIGDFVYREAQDRAIRNDKRQYAKAKSEFLKRKTMIDASFEDDRDYATYEERYQQQIEQARDETANIIGNSNVRSAFVNETELDVAQGLVKVSTLARGRERVEGRAEMLDTLQQNLESIYQAPDEFTREEVLANSNHVIETALALDYIDDIEADKARKNFAADYARTRAKTMAPQELTDIITRTENGENTWLKYMPLDERVDLKVAVDDEIKGSKAFAMADDLMARGVSLEEAFAETKAIKDPDLRQRTEQRFEKLRTLEDRRVKEETYTQFMGNYIDLMRGNKSVDEMTRDELMQFEQPQINAMIAAETNYIKGQQRTASDLDVIYTLEALNKRQDYDGMMDLLMSEDINRLTLKDAESYLKIAASREVPAEVKPFWSAKDYLTATVKPLNLSSEKEMYMRQEFENYWTTAQLMNNGKDPNMRDWKAQIDEMFKVVGGDDWVPFNESRLYENPGVVTEQYIKQNDPTGYSRIMDAFKAQNPDAQPTPEELVETYIEYRRSQ